jgi:hypothetical protein
MKKFLNYVVLSVAVSGITVAFAAQSAPVTAPVPAGQQPAPVTAPVPAGQQPAPVVASPAAANDHHDLKTEYHQITEHHAGPKRDKSFYVQQLTQRITDVTNAEKASTALSVEKRAEVDLKIKCAQLWLSALNGYQSADTKYQRSSRLGHGEVLSAKALLKSNDEPKDHFSEKKCTKLAERLTTARQKGAALQGDNKLAFDTMIGCAKEYSDFISQNKEKKVHFNNLGRRALRYLIVAEDFAHNRTPHAEAHKHDSAAHTASVSIQAVTAPSPAASAPLTNKK